MYIYVKQMSSHSAVCTYLNPLLLLDITFVRLCFIALSSILLIFADTLEVIFIVVPPVK
uniref:Uncharacterized protein n=1 Tax=Anguilla anguilla TaxID=7936 RepID=A0A0E9Q9G1_ANGAN